MNYIKILIYKLKRNFVPSKVKSKEYKYFLQSKGIEIGEGSKFYSAGTINIDIQRPWMLKIGKNCKFTEGVTVLTHDYSRSVLFHAFNEYIGESKKTTIGDNVFVGMKSIILMGSTIGDNVIIGAGSVVTGTIPSNTVVAGNPARVLFTLEEYLMKRKKSYVNEAVDSLKEYYTKYDRFPDIREFKQFINLFVSRKDIDILKKEKIRINFDNKNLEESLGKILLDEPIYMNFEHFKKSVINSIKKQNTDD